MFNQWAFINRLDAADTDELRRIVTQPNSDEEKVLRTYLGNDRYQRLRSLALRLDVTRRARSKLKGNVVIIPELLGSELTSTDDNDNKERIWLSPLQIVAGQLDRLRLDPAGRAQADPKYQIHATGIMKRYYGELILALAEKWNVHAFWYDWRKDLKLAAADLQARINHWFADQEPVHIVAHGAGGLIARAFIKMYPDRWNVTDDQGRQARLIMLGTPNHGAYVLAQAITGQLNIIQWVNLLDVQHNNADFRAIATSFPSLYQLLPSPFYGDDLEKQEELKRLYDVKSYAAEAKISSEHLKNSYEFHKLLSEVAEPERMVSIAGYNQPTFVGLKIEALRHSLPSDTLSLNDIDSLPPDVMRYYDIGVDGDGTTPWRLTQLAKGGQQVPCLYIDDAHGNLQANRKVLDALDELLEQPLDEATLDKIGQESGLERNVPEPHTQNSGVTNTTKVQPNGKDARKRWNTIWLQQRLALTTLLRRVQTRNAGSNTRTYITAEERAIEEILIQGFLNSPLKPSRIAGSPYAARIPQIKLTVVCGNLANVDKLSKSSRRVDALAIGHYSGGEKPRGAMMALDQAISAHIQGYVKPANDDTAIAESDLLLTQYTQRGILRCELAQPFFLADPRPQGCETSRVIAIAGMGVPGRFGAPELMILARELCWSVGRLGKRHLASVLIGAGNDNLAVVDAVTAWVRGIRNAITGADFDPTAQTLDEAELPPGTLAELTFVEIDPRKFLEIDEALCNEQARYQKSGTMQVIYKKLTTDEKNSFKKKARQYAAYQWRREQDKVKQEQAPTRMTVELNRNTYRFGAITDTASIPEREIPLDPELVMHANDELAGEGNEQHQLELGQFMARLLLPKEMRDRLSSPAPLVMMLDATTARIHWELLAHSEPIAHLTDENKNVDLAPTSEDKREYFLGISRGFTRQLRTTFAPVPEPLPPPSRHLRVLVVADPALDARLPGAEEEGDAVADLFERFNAVYAHSNHHIEVVRLLGPQDATRTAVLRELMMRSYDVLHFAGHCMYDKSDPAASGWIFTNGQRLSANEFRRIDRIPKFIFSNACESGITPDRSGERSIDLAPSFAEEFFARGVSNFVCTAWPVDDRSALDFALTLYANLLGMGPAISSGNNRRKQIDPQPMHVAMRAARSAVASPPNDIRTWGAYQHYGNPNFRFFDPVTMKEKRAKKGSNEVSDAKLMQIADAAASETASPLVTKLKVKATGPNKGEEHGD